MLGNFVFDKTVNRPCRTLNNQRDIFTQRELSVLASPACYVCEHVLEKMAFRVSGSADVYRHNSVAVMGSADLFSFGNDSSGVMRYWPYQNI